MGRAQAKRRKNNKFALNESHFTLQSIEPITETQEKVFAKFHNGEHLFLHGYAGTGKSYIACYLAIQELMNPPPQYKNLTVVRSVVPTRYIGFLPGTEEQKVEVYEAPYRSIFNSLFQRGDAYELLRKKSIVNFMTTSYIRGITLEDSLIIIDECQNMTFHELDSIITRVGDNCRVIFCGDFRQSDFQYSDERTGLMQFISVVKHLEYFSFIEFNEDDIVRSELVKSYIIKKTEQGLI